MAQSRSRHEEESFLIAGNRSWFHACVDFIFTLFFWVYSLTVVLFFLSATFGFTNPLTRTLNTSFNTINQDIRHLVILAIGMFLLFYVALYINRSYNKQKFGTLHRRSYPTPANNTELESLGLMDIEAIEKLQREDYAVFDANPITSLKDEKR